MNRKTAHAYDKRFTGEYGQIRDVVIVEATWLGYFEPYTEMPINSFVYDMMTKREQLKLAQEYNLLPFTAKVLSPTRTICEKIMSLVRFSYGENPIEDLGLKIRHAYDLHQLLRAKEFSDFFHSDAFADMLVKVGQDDVASYRSNNQWLKYHPLEALIFKDLENTWSKLKAIYESDFKAMVFGDEFPGADEVLGTLQQIKEQLSAINWTVVIPEDGKP